MSAAGCFCKSLSQIKKRKKVGVGGKTGFGCAFADLLGYIVTKKSLFLAWNVSESPCFSSLTPPPAVRNDRNKKKKDVKEEVVLPESYELSGELEELVNKVSKAHQETFPSLCQLGKYTTVSVALVGKGPAGTHSLHTAPPNTFPSSHLCGLRVIDVTCK